MPINKLKFIVIENAEDVCEGIIRRMLQFPKWNSIGHCPGIDEAKANLQKQLPQLVFLDWGLVGGSAFELLDFIKTIPGYNPFIIFNTGYQKDHPEIPMELVNKYRVDKYIVKPIWENLHLNLKSYVEEAEAKFKESLNKAHDLWLKDIQGFQRKVDVKLIAFILQHQSDNRCKCIYLYPDFHPLIIKDSWQNIFTMLDDCNVDYFVLKNRSHLVVKKYIEQYERPLVKMKGYNLRLDVVRENQKYFQDWLTG